MKVTAYKIIMTLHGANAEGPVDLDRELVVVGISPEDALERVKARYENSLESVLSHREPLSYRVTIDQGDILDVNLDRLKVIPPRDPIELVSPTMPPDYSEFWRPIPTEIGKAKVSGKDAEAGVRLYSYTFGSRWMLQVRGHLMLADRSYSDTFVVSSAGMRVEDMRALRDAIQVELTRCGES